jgi:hypothetical protein
VAAPPDLPRRDDDGAAASPVRRTVGAYRAGVTLTRASGLRGLVASLASRRGRAFRRQGALIPLLCSEEPSTEPALLSRLREGDLTMRGTSGVLVFALVVSVDGDDTSSASDR